MPTSTTTPNPFNRSQQEQVTVELVDRDGVVENTTPITWSTDDATIVDVKVQPADTLGRSPLLIGKGPTLGAVNVRGLANLPVASGGPTTVIIACGPIADTPNQAAIICTFDAAVAKT
jgi:hypothetical protein